MTARSARFTFFVTLGLLITFGRLVTAEASAAGSDPPGEIRTLEAHPLTGQISVDGRLDEPDWQNADSTSDFVLLEPDEGAPASHVTTVRVVRGPSALYIGAELTDTEGRTQRPITRRNDTGDADYFMVSIDGSGTGRSAYLFGVTAAGVQIDATEEQGVVDHSWDAVWSSAVRSHEGGWSVEMAIPYSMLRFPRGAEYWGIQFQRRHAHSGELSFWQPVRREEMDIGIIAGRLNGVQGIAPRSNIQVRPYTLSRLSRAPEAGTGPLYEHSTGFDVGADLKMSLGSNLILDATVNPDFGQVEADPEVLNLTTFETFFPERRPFFLEGTSIFDYTFGPGDGPLLYTRRIGGLGRIVGAGKLTGSTAGGMTFGVLTATTSDGFEGDQFTGDDFEPNLIYGAARVKREFGDRSFVGGAVTYFDGHPGDFVGDQYRSVVVGLDWDYRFADGHYRWDAAITGTQRNHGPDLNRSDIRAIGLYTGLDRVRGVWTGGVSLRVFSADFNPNDVGFFREDDVIRLRGWTRRLINSGQPFGPFRLAFVGGYADQKYTASDRQNLGLLSQWHTSFFFRDYQQITLRANFVDIGGVDVRESRGLGPVRNFSGIGGSIDYSTDTRRRFVFAPRTSVGFYPEGGTAWNVVLGGRWSATDRLALSLTTRYEQRDRVRAWVANETFRHSNQGWAIGANPNTTPGNQPSHTPLPSGTDLGGTFAGLQPVASGDDFSDYYVSIFGARAQRSVDGSVRATYSFRPNLSLQVYSQLFAAKFRYDDFRLLADSHDLRDLSAYPRRRDESRRSLNLNAVMRWEYRPGSTLFVVWSHGRLAELGGYVMAGPNGEPPSPFDRDTFGLALDTFDLQPTNVVLVKLNYLLMR